MSCDVLAAVAELTTVSVCVFVTITATLAEEEIALLFPAVDIGVAFSDAVVIFCVADVYRIVICVEYGGVEDACKKM